jgi:hypothetical protein
MNTTTIPNDVLGIWIGANMPNSRALRKVGSSTEDTIRVEGGMGVKGGETLSVQDRTFVILLEAEFGGAVGGGRWKVDTKGRDGGVAKLDGEFFAGLHEHLVSAVVGLVKHWKQIVSDEKKP